MFPPPIRVLIYFHGKAAYYDNWLLKNCCIFPTCNPQNPSAHQMHLFGYCFCVLFSFKLSAMTFLLLLPYCLYQGMKWFESQLRKPWLSYAMKLSLRKHIQKIPLRLEHIHLTSFVWSWSWPVSFMWNFTVSSPVECCS